MKFNTQYSHLFSKRLFRRIVSGTMVLLLLASLYDYVDLDDQLYAAWIKSTTSEETKNASIWLSRYHLDYQANLEGIRNNLSGITYSQDSKSYWAVINNPQVLLELDEDLRIIRQIKLHNFEDTEAVASAGMGKLVIADERDQSIVIAPITTTTTSLDKKQLKRLTLNTHGGDNKGFEGITVDTQKSLIYVARERDPMMLLSIRGLLSDDQTLEIDTHHSIYVEELYLDDLSGLHFDEKSGNLLLLSDESKALAEITTEGKKISYMDLISGFHGLINNIPQAEGVTIGPDRSIIIVSEPNYIYRFRQ